MKIVFLSNFFNHHQKPFSDEMFQMIGDDYCFIETIPMEEERIKMGWNLSSLPSYVMKSYGNYEKSIRLIDLADVVIIGSAPEKMLKSRKKDKKIIIRYSERPLKRGFQILKYVPRFFLWHKKNPSNIPIYLLCASAYTARDYRKFGLFKNKAYKWGYFPELKEYESIQNLISSKKKHSILWAARFIDWKHPELVIELAECLKVKNYEFEIIMIGCGPLEKQVQSRIQNLNLSKYIRLCGPKNPKEVRLFMEKCEIFISTSDQNEGWGAVVNESMNSACAVVADERIGSVPFLIQNGINGFAYKCKQEFFYRVEQLLINSTLRTSVSQNAYKTVFELWNPKIAASRLLALCESLVVSGECDCFENGPCSRSI